MIDYFRTYRMLYGRRCGRLRRNGGHGGRLLAGGHHGAGLVAAVNAVVKAGFDHEDVVVGSAAGVGRVGGRRGRLYRPDHGIHGKVSGRRRRLRGAVVRRRAVAATTFGSVPRLYRGDGCASTWATVTTEQPGTRCRSVRAVDIRRVPACTRVQYYAGYIVGVRATNVLFVQMH